MFKRALWCGRGLVVFVAAVWPALAAWGTTVRAVGPFNVIFYQSGEGDSFNTGQQNWSTQQMDDVASSIVTWQSRIGNTAGRQINLHMFWYNFTGSILGGTYTPSYGSGGTSWSYPEHVWRDGVNYNAPWSQWDAFIELDTDAAGTAWNFGTATPTSGQIDFRSVVTHEVGHMLGFADSYNSGAKKWGTTWGTATDPQGFAGYNGITRWDQKLRDSAGNMPANGSSGTPRAFNVKDDPVYFIGANAVAYNGGNVAIYAPNPYSGGSSLSHLDEATFPNALMSPQVALGQRVRQPTALEWAIMQDLGWTVVTRTMVWGSGTFWDTVSYNWLWNGNALLYADGDNVRFDDTGLGGVITLNGARTPGDIVLANSSKSYQIQGNTLGGAGSIAKSGSGTVTFYQTTHTHTGGTSITGGTLSYRAKVSAATATLSFGSADISINGGTFGLNVYDNWTGGDPVVMLTNNFAVGSGGGTIDTTPYSGNGKVFLSGNLNLTGILTLYDNNALADAEITGAISGAGLTKTGAGKLVLSGSQSWNPGAVYSAQAGTTVFGSDAGSPAARKLTVNADSAVNFAVAQHLAGLNVGTTTVSLSPGGNKTLVTGSLSIAGGASPTGKLDLNDNNLIVDYTGSSPASSIRDWLKAGYDSGETGNGIISSAAAANGMALGWAEAGDLYSPGTVWSGQTLDSTMVLVAYTAYGDADLDGMVDGSDLAIMSTNWLATGANWSWADCNNDGVVDGSDLAIMAMNWNYGVGLGGMSFSQALALTPVPEPATVMLLVVGAGIWIRRRCAAAC